MIDKEIPFIGIISYEKDLEDFYIESYNYETAQENDFHHSFCLSEKGLHLYDDDDNTLRFIMYAGDDYYTLEGNTSLDPFNTGYRQIKAFVEHVLKNGAKKNTKVKIAQHHLNTEYENKFIGTLEDWCN